jgi:hypothetical protein
MDGNAQAPSFKSSNRLPPKHLFLGQSWARIWIP